MNCITNENGRTEMKDYFLNGDRVSDEVVRIVSASWEGAFDLAGQTVADVQKALAYPFNIRPTARAFVNGISVEPSYRLQPKDVLEFVEPDGKKSILDPEEKAQLDRIEAILTRLFGEPADHGSPGRSVETLEIATFINQLRHQGLTWKEVLKACRERWPNDGHVRNAEQVRATFRRHFGTCRKRSD